MTRRELLGAGIAAGASLSLPLRTLAQPTGAAVKVSRLAEDRFEVIVPKDRPFRILQITDTHFGSPTVYESYKDSKSRSLIRELVRTHRPDYVFHTGDFINNDKEKPDHSAIEFMSELGLPWSVVFGNHDHPDGGAGQKSLADYYGSLGNANVGRVERTGSDSDYCYRLDLKTGRGKPFASLIAFNTGSGEKGMKVSESQRAWFRDQLEEDLRRGVQSPILVMQHIPTVEYRDVFDQKLAIGRKGENVCFEQDQGEIFGDYAASGRVRAVFCGHDHVNDYLGTLRGVKLVYGRCTGYSGYGDWERGGRIIEIDPESGRGSTRVVLGRLAHERTEWSQTLAQMALQ